MNQEKQGAPESTRFEFGANWARYLALVADQRIAVAEQSLRDMLGRENLEGLRFRDIGSGGWLFEVAKPDEIFRFYRQKQFSLTNFKTCACSHGCSEFVFRASPHSRSD